MSKLFFLADFPVRYSLYKLKVCFRGKDAWERKLYRLRSFWILYIYTYSGRYIFVISALRTLKINSHNTEVFILWTSFYVPPSEHSVSVTHNLLQPWFVRQIEKSLQFVIFEITFSLVIPFKSKHIPQPKFSLFSFYSWKLCLDSPKNHLFEYNSKKAHLNFYTIAKI